jgi:carboxypeptidase family protein
MRLARIAGAGLVSLATLTAAAGAQELRGRIVGTVTDNSGAVLPGVTVTAASPALMQPQTATSGTDGSYRFPALPSGTYTLTYEIGSFQTMKREGIRVLLNTTLTVDAQLQVAGLAEALTVSGESPAVDIKTTSIGTSFTKELLQDIPNARDVWAAMSQAPGFQMQGYDVGGSHTGTQTGYMTYGVDNQNKTLLEGINVTESTNANAGYFDFGSFEEFQLGGAGNLGEQAGPGALMNITVKSGGDQWHADVYFDYEGENTIADNVPDAYRTPGATSDGFLAPTIRNPETGQNEGLRAGNPITKQYDFNVGIGGPIVKNKLWVYAGYRDNNQYKTILGLPGEEAQSKLSNWTAKLTYQINPKNQLIGFFNHRTKLQPLRDLSLAIPVETAYYQASRNRPMKLEWTSVLSDRAFLDVQVAHWFNAFPLYPTSTKSSSTEGVPVGRIDLATNQQSGANNAYQDQFRYKPQVSANLSYFVDSWGPGTHSFKVGADWQRDRKEFLAFQPGDIYYRDRSGVTQEVDVWNTPNNSINDAVNLALYVNDTWAVKKRFTLNWSLRYDRYALGWPAQGFEPNQGAFFQPVTSPATDVVTLNTVSPRLGFAWDLNGRGKTVLKAFYGRYAYNPSADVADRENPVGAAQIRYEFRPCTPGQTSGCDLNGNKLVDGRQELGRELQRLGGAGFVTIDRDIQHPYGQEFSTSLEHELFPSVSLRGSYVFKGNRNEWAEVDLARVNAYTIPFTYRDVGADNQAGTADDQVIQLFDRPRDAPSNRVYTNPGRVGLPSFDSDYHTVEFAVNRRMKDRWMLLTSFEHTWANDFRNPAQASTSNLAVMRHATAYLWRPNQRLLGSQASTMWNFKLVGRYEFPLGFSAAASYKLQSGFPWARAISVTLPNAGAETIFAEPIDANRAPNVGILDFRAEKAFALGGRRGRLVAMLDVFNATNADTVTNFRNVTGPRFMELIALLDPRIVRFGLRYQF